VKVGDIDFLKFVAGEEQNLITTLINLLPDFDVFSHLSGLFRGPAGLIDVPILLASRSTRSETIASFSLRGTLRKLEKLTPQSTHRLAN